MVGSAFEWTLLWVVPLTSNNGKWIGLVWDPNLKTQKSCHWKVRNNPTITSKMNMSPKKVPFQKEFSWDTSWVFLGNDCIKTASTQLGLSTERAAVPPAAAVVAPWQRLPPRWQIQAPGPRPVASAMEGWEAPAQEEHLDHLSLPPPALKKGEEKDMSLVIF